MYCSFLSKLGMQILSQLKMMNVPFDYAGNGENEPGAMVEGIPTRHLLQTVSGEIPSLCLCTCGEG